MPQQRPYMSIRPTFSDLQDRHVIDLDRLSTAAQVHESVIDSMLSERPVYRSQAEKVLRALSQQAGKTYTLETVRVPLYQGVHHAG